MHQTDKEQLIEYLKIAGFTYNPDVEEFIKYVKENLEILIFMDTFMFIETIWNEKSFKKRIITEVEGYTSILTYLKINFKINENKIIKNENT